MENTTNLKKNIPLFERLARISFILYMITLYVFVDKIETVGISRIIFVLYAGFAVLTLLERKRIYIGKNMLFVYMTITWMYATTFWAYNRFYATEKMNTVWMVFLLLFITYNLFAEDEEAHEYLIKSLYISGICLLGYSVHTYGFSQVIEMMSSNNQTRLGAEINQANSFGMMNATTVIVAFYYFFYKKRYKLFHISAIAVAFLFTMSSGSRKALLMVCLGVLFLVYKKYGIKKIYKIVVVGAILIFAFVQIMKLPMFNFINRRLEMSVELVTGEGEGDSSANVRYNMIEQGWNIFKQRILYGYGADNYAIVSGYGVYSHNNIIEVLVDFGLIGFILYYTIYIVVFKELSSSKKNASKALLGLFIVRTLMEIAVVSYYSKQHWVLLAFFLIGDRKKYHTQIPDEESDEIDDSNKENYEANKERVKEFMEEERSVYEPENICEETEESFIEPENCFAGFVGEGACGALVYGQDISETEILGNNGEKTQS